MTPIALAQNKDVYNSQALEMKSVSFDIHYIDRNKSRFIKTTISVALSTNKTKHFCKYY